MRITADTNVMVSSTYWAGASDKVIKLVEDKEIEMVLSEEIIKEYIKVLEYEEVKKKVKEKKLSPRRTAEKILSISEIISPQERIRAVKEDPSDNKFLECAVEGEADYLISKDKHLLKLRKYKGIKIIKPEEFLKLPGTLTTRRLGKQGFFQRKPSYVKFYKAKCSFNSR